MTTKPPVHSTLEICFPDPFQPRGDMPTSEMIAEYEQRLAEVEMLEEALKGAKSNLEGMKIEVLARLGDEGIEKYKTDTITVYKKTENGVKVDPGEIASVMSWIVQNKQFGLLKSTGEIGTRNTAKAFAEGMRLPPGLKVEAFDKLAHTRRRNK